jgi:hypothetical protein
MNRIILIGNGFDLAHGLKTKYTDFINWYWTDFASKVFDRGGFKPHSDDVVRFRLLNGGAMFNSMLSSPPITSYPMLKGMIERVNASGIVVELKINNDFFKQISDQTGLSTWLDIENEYYENLKRILSEKFTDDRYRKEYRCEKIKKLNNDFRQVKDLLKEYLLTICNNSNERKEIISLAIGTLISFEDIAHSKKDSFYDHILWVSNVRMEEHELRGRMQLSLQQNKISKGVVYRHIERLVREKKIDLDAIKPNKTIFLNFNYTKTAEKHYACQQRGDVVINIHGELNNDRNRMIFGYGDELDEDYKEIERLQNNDFLENIKSIQYHNTSNYRELLRFLNYEPYQVFIMGHSCGNSDRTLLNTIFEHENCISVKPFYHQWWNKDTQKPEDDYTKTVMNISRNFNDKQKMRDIVVNWDFCSPLVPCDSASK